jgi:Zn-dependent protease with chaperone function
MSSLLFALRGFTLGLVWFGIVNAIAALLVACVARHIAPQEKARPAAFWLGLRFFPAAASTVLVAMVFVPSYWTHEPRGYAEGFQGALASVALVAFVIVVAALARGAAAWMRASRRATCWMRVAHPIALAGASMPSFRIDVDAPVMALVGIFTPRLFISRRVLSMLSEEELAASVAHEVGHRRAFDNLKRLALCGTPDLLATTQLARDLEQRWAAAAEHDADRSAYATVDGAARTGARCALASAIVKVARLVPPAGPIAEPISTLVDGTDIASRVHSLLDGDADIRRPRTPPRLAALAVAAIGAIAFAPVVYAPLLRAVHEATEFLVHSLP